MPTLTPEALAGIASYKYKSGTYTWLDLQLNHFWNWCVNFLPLWMAPNLVTTIGTGIVVLSSSTLWYYSPHFSEAAPSWVYWLCAIGLFAYQTLDAIDGKQARRTGSSSPLGQLFDHGCDALCTVFNMLSASCSVLSGPNWYTFSMLMIVGMTFYLAQWEEYHTGTMSCGNGYFGVTEGQLVLIFIHIISATLGPQIWSVNPIPFIPLSMFNILFVTLILTNVLLCSGNVKSVLTEVQSNLSKEEKGNKNVSKSVALLQILPIVTMFIIGALWISGPDAEDYAQHPILYLFSIGMGFVLLSTRMIVCHMCKVPFSPQFRILIPMIALVLNCYAPYFGLSKTPPVSPFIASLSYCVFIVIVYLQYGLSVCFEICHSLNIYLLTLGNPSKTK